MKLNVLLASRFEHLYASVWFSIRIDACGMRKAIDLFLSADAWPVGVLARRYYHKKDG